MTEELNQKFDANGVQVESSLPANYEAALNELEKLVTSMESGNLSLENSLIAYRRGAALVAHCQQQLASVEQQVQVLEGEVLQPFSATEIKRSVEHD